MNNHRKIGFRAYNDNAQNSEEDEQKKKQARHHAVITDFRDNNGSSGSRNRYGDALYLDQKR